MESSLETPRAGKTRLSHDMKFLVSSHIVREWRDLGRHLLSDNCDFMRVEAIINNVDRSHHETQEKCYQMLITWEEMNSSSATAEAVVKALRNMQNNLVANELQTMIQDAKSSRAQVVTWQGSCRQSSYSGKIKG